MNNCSVAEVTLEVAPDCPRPVKNVKTPLTKEEAMDLLKKTSAHRCTSLPALEPKNGDIFLFSFSNSKNKRDYVADGISWRNRGVKNLPASDPSLRKEFFQRKVLGKVVPSRRYTYELLREP
jgi:hypothetical protein